MNMSFVQRESFRLGLKDRLRQRSPGNCGSPPVVRESSQKTPSKANLPPHSSPICTNFKTLFAVCAHHRCGSVFSSGQRPQIPWRTVPSFPDQFSPLTGTEHLETFFQLLFWDVSASRWPAQQHAREQHKQLPSPTTPHLVIVVLRTLCFFKGHPQSAAERTPSKRVGLFAPPSPFA